MLDPADGNGRGRPLHLKVYEVDPMLCPQCCGQMKGLTWWVSDVEGERYIAHSGSVNGYTAFCAANLDRRTGVAILTNGNKAHRHLYNFALKALAARGD